MPDAVELVKTIKKSAIDAMESTKPVNVYFGTVESVSPLKINVEQKMVLGESQLVLTRNVTDYKMLVAVDMSTESTSDSHTHTFQGKTQKDGEPEHEHEFKGSTAGASSTHSHHIAGEQEITIRNSLVAGDEVLLIRQQGGQKYIVWDRIGT